jgi:ribosomal protein S18 acetylase RimI-like enzyme
VIEYRTFRNTDPPAVAELWRTQSGRPGWMQPMSVALFDRHVLSRAIFDRQGLIVATDAGRLVGLVHAVLEPAPPQHAQRIGTIALLLARPDASEVLAELLARAENYLRERGATAIQVGSLSGQARLYFGLYGGAEPTGLLDADTFAREALSASGYRESGRSIVFRRELATFRPIVDRRQLQVRRANTVEMFVEPPPADWMDAMTFEPFARTRYRLMPRAGGAPQATVDLWNMDTMLGVLGAHAVGIVDLIVLSEHQRKGLAQFLLGEALRQAHTEGAALAEAHVDQANAPAVALFRGLGFDEIDHAIAYRKD